MAADFPDLDDGLWESPPDRLLEGESGSFFLARFLGVTAIRVMGNTYSVNPLGNHG